MNAVYQEIVARVSTELTNELLTHETNLARRARFIDADIAEITRQIGLETTQKLLEHVRDQEVKKNVRPD
jgi:hypothetical protein